MHTYLETERLRLREFTPEDGELLFELDSDPAVMRYLNGGQPPDAVRIEESLARMLAFYAQGQGFGYWAVIEKAGGDFLGWFHFRPARDNPDAIDLGYRLRRAAWGQGYATEASRALIRKGFTELGVQRVVAQTLADNAASIAVMSKAGLTFSRTFVYEGGQGWHIGLRAVEYALERDEWLRREQG